MVFLFLFMYVQSVLNPVARGILLNIRSYYPPAENLPWFFTSVRVKLKSWQSFALFDLTSLIYQFSIAYL